MKVFDGAVCFIDMLGMRSLTRGLVPLRPTDFAARDLSKDADANHSHFAAKLLMTFRDALRKVRASHSNVSLAQLSDSAFVWSKDVQVTANAVRELMWQCLMKGLLCFAGLAFGQIVEPDRTDHSLGRFVVGQAATDAVGLERSGKGCRVFTEPEVVRRVRNGPRMTAQTFQPLKSPLDGTFADEFRWYLSRDPLDSTERSDGQDLATVTAMLRCSTLFGWNCTSAEGHRQVAVSIESLSAALSVIAREDFTVRSEFVLKGLMPRGEKHVEKLTKAYLSALSCTGPS